MRNKGDEENNGKLIGKVSENNSQKSCNIHQYIVYLHLISSEKCQFWHKSEVVSVERSPCKYRTSGKNLLQNKNQL